ncbi:MAG: hypothetical protein ACI4OS_01900, partial [Akkermansia sp.]
MSSFPRLFLFSALSAVCLSACSWQQQAAPAAAQKEAEENKATLPPPLHLGAVHQVYPEQGFCLLRMLGPIPVPGTTLISHPADGSNDRAGNLCVSNSQGSRNGMIAADIRSGIVLRGDRVFLYRDIAAPQTQEEEEQSPAEEDDTVRDDDPLLNTPITEEPPPAAPAPSADAPSVDTTVLPAETQPDLPDSPSGKLDDIPDDIN